MTKLSAAELAKKAKEVFDSNEKLNEAFQTTDGQCFDREDNAVNHQINLTKEGSEVKKVTRGEKVAKAETGEGATELKFADLQALCTTNQLPEEEWIKLKSKKEVAEYLTSKGIEIK